MSGDRLNIYDANMHEALRSYYARGGTDTVEPATIQTPFLELLGKEGDADEGEVGEWEWRQRILGVRAMFRWILAEGFHPLKIMKRLYAIGRALDLEPFNRLTMREQGLMFSETKAAVSWRMKQLSGLIKGLGMNGHRLAGQKTSRASDAARAAALGNHNRANGKARRKPAARQKSFLRSLHVKRKPKASQP